MEGQQCQKRQDRRHIGRATGGLLVVSLSILVATGRKKHSLAMVTAMEDSCPNGAQEEEEVTPLGQHAVEGPPAVRSTQGAETSGGEDSRRKMGAFKY